MKFTTVAFVALGLFAGVWAAPEETAAKVEAVKTVETKPAVTAALPKVEKDKVKTEVEAEEKQVGTGGKVVEEQKIVKIEESAATTAVPPKVNKKEIFSHVITTFVNTVKAVGNKIKGIFGFGKKNETKKEETKPAVSPTRTFTEDFKGTEVPKKVVVEEKKVVEAKKADEKKKKNDETVQME